MGTVSEQSVSIMKKLDVLCFLPHGKGTWEAKQTQDTAGAAVSSAADTQEERRSLLTSPDVAFRTNQSL